MEALIKAFREVLEGNERMIRVVRSAIQDIMAAMKNYNPAPMQNTDPINLDP